MLTLSKLSSAKMPSEHSCVEQNESREPEGEKVARVLATRDGKIARINVLAIHFTFKGMENERKCNAADVKNLKEIFSSYQNCVFEERASPTRAEILRFLTSEGTAELFPRNEVSGPPDIYILLILSHGNMNGVITTDKEEEFTTEEVTKGLGDNDYLEDALKMIFFGPCKGDDVEKLVTAATVGAYASPLSMKILAEPNQKNFAIFYSTMESMAAITDLEGSWMVRALCNTLKELKENVNVLELFRLVQVQIENKSNDNNRQMPQSYVYPHDKTITFCKWEKGIGKDGAGDVSFVAPPGREAFFEWRNGELKYNRGVALVFGTKNVDLCTALKDLDYQTECKNLNDIVETLDCISSNGMVERTGSLFVVVFGKLVVSRLEKVQPEWAIDAGNNELLPIGMLTRKFVGTACPTFAAKPKILIFINSDVSKDQTTQQVKILPMKFEPSCMNHQHFLVIACHGKGALDNLIGGLGRLRAEESELQEEIMKIVCAPSMEPNVNLVWSTMTYLVDFPEVLDNYSPHQLVERDDELQEARRYNIEQFVTQQAAMILKGRAFVVRVYGLGLTRFAEELHSRLVVKVDADIVLAKLDEDPKISNLTEVDIVEYFTVNALNATKRRVVIAVGWSNLNNEQKHNAIQSFKRLARNKVMLFVMVDSEDDFLLQKLCRDTFELDISECSKEMQESLRKKREDKLEKQRRMRSRQERRDSSDDFFLPQPISEIIDPKTQPKKGLVKKKFSDAYEWAEMIAKSSAGSAFVLSCGPGMGKSVNLRHIEMALQRKLGDFRVVRLDLRACFKELDDFTDKMNGPEDVLSFIETKSPLEKDKVAERKVIVLLDSLDEVVLTRRDVTLQLLERLKEMQIKMLVATRPQEEKCVVQALAPCDIFTLDLINAKDQLKFIGEVSTDQSHVDRATKLLKIVRLDRRRQDVWGIPLNLVMLSEVCRDDKITEDSLKDRNLYGLMIEKSIENTENFYNRSDSRKSQEEKKDDIAKRIARVEELAVKYILGKERIEATKKDTRRYIDRYAFLDFDSNTKELRFTHATYAEYLVAVQVVRKLNGDHKENGPIVEEELLQIVDSVNVLQFVDSLLQTLPLGCTLPTEMKSEKLCYTCIENEFLNIFKLLHRNDAVPISSFKEKISNGKGGKKFPLEILMLKGRNNRCKNNYFADYLVGNGASLKTFVNKQNRREMLDEAIESLCNKLARNNWKTLKPRGMGRTWSLAWSLDKALMNNNEEMARFLIDKGSLLDDILQKAIVTECSKDLFDFVLQKIEFVSESDFVEATRNVEYLKLLLPKIQSDHMEVYKAKALTEAALCNRPAAVKYLLENGADPNKEDKDGYTSLDHAAEGGAVKCFDLLFDQTDIKDLDRLLLHAAEAGSMEIFERLLCEGADLNAVDAQGNTFLHRATMSNKSTDCLAFLLENHLAAFDIEARNNEGKTPLLLATQNIRHSERAVALLLAKDANPAARDTYGYTPLHYAARQFQECKWLLGKIANVEEVVNSRTNEGKTPLLLAVDRNGAEAVAVVKLLMENGADITMTDGQGKNCLHLAAENGNIHCVAFFLEKGFAVDGRCDGGLTPLMLASKHLYGDAVIKLLIEKGADANLLDELGWNCLHHAAANRGCDKNAEALLPFVADVKCATKNGKTALQLAKDVNQRRVISLLEGQAVASNVNFTAMARALEMLISPSTKEAKE